jgi:NAD dependent epimerase/dehydratase family enzyme
MAEMLLSSQRCSDAKVLESGYHFQYKNATTALKAIYS